MAYLRWLFLEFRGSVVEIPWRLIIFLYSIFLIFLPLFFQNSYLIRILTITMIFILYSASWGFLAGTLGQISLGHSFLFGIGAYVSAFLDIYLDLPIYLTIPSSSIITGITGLIMCLPAFRLRGLYLSIVTIAFPFVAESIFLYFREFTGGDTGLPGLTSFPGNEVKIYYLIFSVVILNLLILWMFERVNSRLIRFPIYFYAIREDEITARATGIPTSKYKALGFFISGIFAGFSGALYGHYIGTVGTSYLSLQNSLLPMIWTLFGGIGSISGAIVGTLILCPILDFVRINLKIAQLDYLIMFAILVIIVTFMPLGITHWIRDHIEVECNRCKQINFIHRETCRGCNAPLYLTLRQKKKYIGGKE